MNYARVVNNVAVDVSTNPALNFTPALAATFEAVPDSVVPGSVRLTEITGTSLGSGTTWQPPRTYIEEYAPGHFRYAQRAAAEAPVYTAPVVARHITRLAFRNRFNQGEKVTIELAAADTPDANTTTRQVQAALRANLADQRDATYIDLDRADTRAGVQALESAGILAPGRAVVILDAPVQEAEVYRGIA